MLVDIISVRRRNFYLIDNKRFTDKKKVGYFNQAGKQSNLEEIKKSSQKVLIFGLYFPFGLVFRLFLTIFVPFVFR